VLASAQADDAVRRCLQSIRSQTPTGTEVLTAGASAAELNRALEQLAPADVVVLEEPCEVTEGWLERLMAAALKDTNTATASALVDAGGELAVADEADAGGTFTQLAADLAARTLALHPRISRAVGPCVYMRRDAFELVGPLDEELDLRASLELDFAQRCLLSGLAHVAADDVVVERLAPSARRAEGELPALLLERYPYLAETGVGESRVLDHALRMARGLRGRLWVTIDARALDGAITGTQVHILELILALARTGVLRLRVLIWAERIDRRTLELLRELPATEILAAEEVGPGTPRSTVFHRPQQAFSAGDVELALALGERIVLSQLDLIAYRNPGYFGDAAAWAEFRRASRHGLSAAERIVVFSEHTRRELLCDALVGAERVKVVPPGLDHRLAGEPRRPAALDDGTGASLSGNFLLCLGTDFRHKNRLFALRLLQSLRADHDWQGSLVLAGTRISHGSSKELEQGFLEEHAELAEAVVELGSVSEEEKEWLLAHAQAVVYPSVYEGFGLVPFESALKGVPCVFAAQSSLAETVPKGIATILPWNATASADAVHALLCDEQARALHVEALGAAARELTWSATANAMVEVYREAATAPLREAASLSRDAVDRERTLSAGHAGVVQTLIGERELVLRDYTELLAELGPGRALVGRHGALPQNLQRALLALSARPALSRPLYGWLSAVYAGLRRASHIVQGLLGRTR
jgi:glycosyltransferase involved in cell wall biosynthesis